MSCNPTYPEENIPLLCVVFCGGKSTRMGTDKGLLEKNGVTWAEIAVEKLEQLFLPVCVSVNASQQFEYAQLFPEPRLIIDAIPVEGPLGALLSAHNAYPEHDLLIMACDMVDIKLGLVERLIKEFRQREGEHDFFVFKNGDEWEPLLGIYTREGLQKIFDLYTLHQLAKHSMKYVLELGNAYFSPLQEEELPQVRNYNTPEELTAGQAS